MSDSISGRTRTPPDLKWLLNERAAVAGSLSNSSERCEYLEENLVALQGELERLQVKLQNASYARSRQQATLTSLDVAIGLAYANVRPDAAGIVRAHANKYGPHGGLQRFVEKSLQDAAPAAIDMRDLINWAILNFKLLILTPSDRKSLNDSVFSVIRKLRARGLIELTSPSRGLPGKWRWKSQATLAELSGKAQRMARAAAEAPDARAPYSNPS